MEATEEQIAAIRIEIGSAEPPTDDDLYETFDRLGDVKAVATEVLRARLGELLSGPAQFSVSGQYSENNTANIEALRQQVNELESDTTSSFIHTVPLVRRDRCGR